MKTITYLAILLFTITGCKCQKTTIENAGTTAETMKLQQELPELVYESLTRGFYQKITIAQGKFLVQDASDAKPKEVILTDADIEALYKAYTAIDVKQLSALKAPTEKRFYDGAPITNLAITEAGEVYKTPDFDGGYPPAYIENLVNTILKIEAKKQ